MQPSENKPSTHSGESPLSSALAAPQRPSQLRPRWSSGARTAWLWRSSGYRYPVVVLGVGQRRLLPRQQRPVYALPPLPHARPRRQEGSVEVLPPSHAADDLVHLYDPRPPVEAFVGNGKL